MRLVSYIVGPQLIGLILFAVGMIMRYFPPRKINSFYGYRTSSSMKNQQTWDEANRYSAGYMMKASGVVIIIGIIITTLLATIKLPGNAFALITSTSAIASGIIPAVLIIVSTEKHLTKIFGNK